MLTLHAELPVQFLAAVPFAGQVGQQAQAGVAIVCPFQQLRVFEIEALEHNGIQRFEQRFLYGEGQGHAQGNLISGAGGHLQHFCWCEDFPGQARGAFRSEHVLRVQAQAAPMLFASDDGSRPASAMSDRAADIIRPDRRAVFAHAWDPFTTLQLQQSGAGAQPAGEKLGLAFGNGSLNAGRWLDCAPREVTLSQFRRVEMAADQRHIRQGVRQGPVMGESWAAGGESLSHGRHFAGGIPKVEER